MGISRRQLEGWRNTTQYVVSGTNTFRLASRSILKLYGSNLQNIEKSARRIYHADAGKLLIQVDQKGAEAVIVAYLVRDANFRKLILNKIKAHIFVGLHIFADEWQKEIDKGNAGKDLKCSIKELVDTPIENLRKNPYWNEVSDLIQSSDNWPSARRFYYIAKQICHSSNYGIGPQRFCLNTLEKSKGKIVLQKKDAEKFLSFYHSMFPEIREWHSEVIEQVKTTNYLFNLFGFPRYFFHKGELDTQDFKEMYAFVPQSTVATINNIAYTQVQTRIEDEKLDLDLLGNTHDSYVGQAKEENALEMARVLKRHMEQELTSPRGEKFRMGAEVSIGFNWGPYDEKKNPLGLKTIENL